MTVQKAVLAFLLAALVLSSSLALVDAQVASLEVEWEQFLSGIDGQKILQTSDGGYLILGQNASVLTRDDQPYFGNYASVLYKLDSQGNLLWHKTYQIQGAAPKLQCIIQTNDKGYLIGGGVVVDYTDQNLHIISRFCLLKTDSNGEIQWTQTYADPEPIGNAAIHSLTQLDDESYVLFGDYDLAAGYTYPKYVPLLFFAQVTSSGELLLNKTLGNGGTPTLLQANSESFTFLSYFPSSGGGSHSALLNVNLDGSVNWTQEYTNPNRVSSHLQCATLASDGTGFLLGGSYIAQSPNQQYSWLIKTDPQGTILWNQTYHQTSTIHDITPAYDGYIICGSFNGGWIAHLDNSGNINTELNTGSGVPYSITQTNDNSGYICTGTWNQQNTQNIWTTKLAPATTTPQFPTAILLPLTSAIILIAVAIKLKTRKNSIHNKTCTPHNYKIYLTNQQTAITFYHQKPVTPHSISCECLFDWFDCLCVGDDVAVPV
ncbi:MAG: hypothetical protein NWF04_10315 [Candidatus Bathyarchaeota archaeon]|nr:hypothetical protein [Candidatus Bathyarchaeota archaeon]